MRLRVDYRQGKLAALYCNGQRGQGNRTSVSGSRIARCDRGEMLHRPEAKCRWAGALSGLAELDGDLQNLRICYQYQSEVCDRYRFEQYFFPGERSAEYV